MTFRHATPSNLAPVPPRFMSRVKLGNPFDNTDGETGHFKRRTKSSSYMSQDHYSSLPFKEGCIMMRWVVAKSCTT